MNKKPYVSNLELKRRLQQQKNSVMSSSKSSPVLDGSLDLKPIQRPPILVKNWKQGWSWMSNLAFAGIVATQSFYDALPPELIASLPADTQTTVTLGLALLGLIGRFINQTRQPKKEVSDV
ncbi:hypothetical protein EC844_12637 [Acinetobacter calcoaceticus]|uniref:Uncharacterized protein n=1 Tax=Acinetobacter calcoaceticus TaxID=471 RepID=A0A4R1XQH3_ACICA|nr:hypothetical protein EC844_12637 [Acinetobacter calcoaceticus]